MALPENVMDAIFEVADSAVNPTGYAEEMDESDDRATKRDDLAAKITALVESELTE